MVTKGNIAQNNLFFIIKQLEIVKIFHKGKEENWSEQEDLDKFYKIVQNETIVKGGFYWVVNTPVDFDNLQGLIIFTLS